MKSGGTMLARLKPRRLATGRSAALGLPERAAKHLIIFAATAALAYSATIPSLSNAAATHRYSTATETSGSSFTGVATTRINQHVSGLPQTGCSAYYTGNPVYQTQWVILSDTADDWHEIGTGHQCGDANHYYFYGYGLNSVWHPINAIPNASFSGSHTLRIYKASATRTEFWIDGSVKASLTTSVTGPEVRAGLETYWDTATVPGYNISFLQYQKDSSAPASWSGRDSTLVNTGMCGLWNSDTSRRVGQGSGQC
jgi:hypothetical protein